MDRVFVEAVGNNLRFQGQYCNVETGLHYNRFRYYDPTSGCFANQDPIRLEGGEITSAYAPNPLQWIDPWGLTRWIDFLKAIKGRQQPNQQHNTSELYPKPVSSGVHGNSLASTKPTVGYIIRENGTGKVLKFGETSNPKPKARYTQKCYNQNNAYIDSVKSGTKAKMHKWQNERIKQYYNRHNKTLPSLNKCFY